MLGMPLVWVQRGTVCGRRVRCCLGGGSLDSGVNLCSLGHRAAGPEERRGAIAHCTLHLGTPGWSQTPGRSGKMGQERHRWVRTGTSLTAAWGYQGMWRDGPGMVVFPRRGFSRSFEMQLLPHLPVVNSSKVEVVCFGQVRQTRCRRGHCEGLKAEELSAVMRGCTCTGSRDSACRGGAGL